MDDALDAFNGDVADFFEASFVGFAFIVCPTKDWLFITMMAGCGLSMNVLSCCKRLLSYSNAGMGWFRPLCCASCTPKSASVPMTPARMATLGTTMMNLFQP